MTPEAAAWVRDNVLPAYMVEQVWYRALVETCPCQWGPCGHCEAGRHEQCAVRRLPPHPSPETYVAKWRGGARTAVWLTGKPCMWRCPCCGTKDWEAEPVVNRQGEWMLFEVGS